ALFYIGWDFYFTANGIWSFNENYITGMKWLNLPVEEVLFFFIVPYCCVFIYECIRCYFPRLQNKVMADILLKSMAIALLIAGIIFYRKHYTSSTFIFCSIFIMFIYGWRKFFKSFDAASFLFSFVFILIPFLIVNGFLTALPVVLYNDAENLGIRLYTIPVEDVFYGMLLVMMNIALYEKLRSRASLARIYQPF
ncbi:MAG: rane protein, partial [Ferruginibacter sp.]|nr:rane protein [Ferruginibacter sp.]